MMTKRVEFHFDEDNNNDGVSSNNTTSKNVHCDSQFLYDKQDKWRIDLMKILNDMRAPDYACLLYTSPSPRDLSTSRMPSSA